MNYIREQEIEKAQNDSLSLGESYIQSCPTLSNFRREFIIDKFGRGSSCTYQQGIDAFDAKKECQANARSKTDLLVNVAKGSGNM